MPENGRKDDLFVPDFVKEAEEQIAKGVKLPTLEEVTIKFMRTNTARDSGQRSLQTALLWSGNLLYWARMIKGKTSGRM